MTKQTEKRRHSREACTVPVDGKIGDFFEQVITTDISRAGIGFISGNEIPLNKEIAIEIDFEENADPVFVIGKVQWIQNVPSSDKFRLGLKFESVLRGSKTRLNNYFKKSKIKNISFDHGR